MTGTDSRSQVPGGRTAAVVMGLVVALTLVVACIELQSGIPLMAVGIGMLALSEVLLQIEEQLRRRGAGAGDTGQFERAPDDRLSLREFASNARTILRSSVIGTCVGALPGLGATIAGFLGYGAAQRASKHPERFGRGATEGIAAAEAANSAVVGANLIPLLALGIPGNVTAALLVGAAHHPPCRSNCSMWYSLRAFRLMRRAKIRSTSLTASFSSCLRRSMIAG